MVNISDEDDYVPSDLDSGVLSERDMKEQDLDVEPRRHLQERRHAASADDYYSADDIRDSTGAESPSPGGGRSPRKRRRHQQQDAHHLPPYAGAPLKRQRRPFNPEYLGVLNQDVADAAASLVAADVAAAESADLALRPSQVGAVRWSPAEKEAFFAALGRLGRDDAPGIAARVGSKGPLEVRQLVLLLAERARQRRDRRGLRQRTLRPAEVPAAAELSRECEAALEGAADDLSLRQDGYEASAEEKRWGDRWLITRDNAREDGAKDADERDMPFLDFFHARAWLRLSDRLFMNSAIPDYNWRYVSEEPPSIRATALSDFHALAASVTRRLVASALFMAGARLKAQRQYMPGAQALVKARDVEAAVDSLHLRAISRRDFWARAPRRLRLDVVRDEAETADESAREELGEEQDGEDDDRDVDDDSDESDEEHVMSYHDVEEALGYSKQQQQQQKETTARTSAAAGDDLISETDSDSDPTYASDASRPEDNESGQDTGDEFGRKTRVRRESAKDLDEDAVGRDMEEAMFFSADYGFTTRARQGLQLRIETEHRMEAAAEEQDMLNSRREEARLQAMIKRTEVPGDVPGEIRAKNNVRQLDSEAATKDWRDNIQYVSEWEVQ